MEDASVMTQIDANAVTVMDILSFLSSIVSIVLAVIAIWIAFYQKGQADKVNEKTINLLIDIRTDAKAITQVASGELAKYGDMSRQLISKSLDRTSPKSFEISNPTFKAGGEEESQSNS